MKIIVYCQHVLGVGHFFRTLEILKALSRHDVVLVSGGGHVEVSLPSHVRKVKLPGLMMDENFSALHSVESGKTVEDIKVLRCKKILELVKKESPDLFLSELFPFGRRAFRFELIPVLDYLKHEQKKRCKIVCSLRDILVDRENPAKYENRVIEALNRHFDAILIHSDPKLIALDNTFSRIDQIHIPLVYTGFITPRPDPDKVSAIRSETGLGQAGKLIVASAGGGNVGAKLLHSTLQAVHLLDAGREIQLQVLTGPYMDETDKKALKGLQDNRMFVNEFTPDFVSLLGAADLSISMGGYNTSMNIVAAGVKSYIWPFSQNREQRTRARSLEKYVPLSVLDDNDLRPERLSKLIEQALDKSASGRQDTLNLNGAENTAEWIKEI